MQDNQPVTQQEYEFADNSTLLSTTDTQSHIVHANAAFVSASGFTPEELLGQPHNLVRHPDMPSEAFADMWDTLRKGMPWSALVKNWRKNGDHYWVRANAAPVVRNGVLIGYLSVRTKPARAEVSAAEALYRQFRSGQARGLRFFRGLVVRSGPLAWLSWNQWLGVSARIRLAMLLPAAGLVGLLAAASLPPGQFLALLTGQFVLLGLTSPWLERQVAMPRKLVLQQALRVATGQARGLSTLNRADEVGLVLLTVNQSALNLRALLDDMSSQAAGVSVASGEIASGNDDLSSRTELTAASLQQTASSMDRLVGTIAVGRLDEMTQQNAALVEQSAAASHAPKHQSQSMKRAVGVFA